MLLYITHNHALLILSYHDYVDQIYMICHHKKGGDTTIKIFFYDVDFTLVDQ